MEFLVNLFNISDFMPHGHCYFWRPEILWPMVFGDALIALSYFSIPIFILYFTRKRKDLKYKWIFALFALFIFCCGATHVIDIITVWKPVYRLDAAMKVTTALVSFTTGLFLFKVVPAALKIPSADHIQKINEQLKSEIGTRMLFEQQLKNKKAKLEQSNKDLEEFAYIISHDLKAPLRSISTLVDFIEADGKDVLTGELKDHFNLVKKNTAKMDQLINGVLEYSRATLRSEDKSKVNISDILRDQNEIFSSKGKVDLKFPEYLPILSGNEIKIKQVFSNLIGNSVEHNDKEIIQIDISYKRLGHYFEFTVADNGPGIEPKFHEQIFQIFKTLNKIQKKAERSGIGLSIVKKIIHQAGGSIRLESESGEGTKFIFTWPAG